MSDTPKISNALRRGINACHVAGMPNAAEELLAALPLAEKLEQRSMEFAKLDLDHAQAIDQITELTAERDQLRAELEQAKRLLRCDADALRDLRRDGNSFRVQVEQLKADKAKWDAQKVEARKRISDCLGGMHKGSAIWSNAPYDKGHCNAITAALTAFDAAMKESQ